ncbi:MAG: hypothetical protein Hals2KO_10210 [Halioglobus sp.]
MGQIQRAGHMDVSNSVDVTDGQAVFVAVKAILQRRYPAVDCSALERLYRDFLRLYSGDYPGYCGCDIRYHNTQHVLDVSLAMARLLEGHAGCHSEAEQISGERVLAGMAAALFHDSGYIRRTRDTRHKNGAAYTRVHVARSARFLKEYLPSAELPYLVGTCTRIVHFTGYDVEPEKIPVADDGEYLLGTLLGTADLIAQMADIDYVRKCREYLYEEFVAGGMAGSKGKYTHGHTGTIYRSPEQLLSLTPSFIRNAIDVRLDRQFNSAHRYAAAHFNGRHLYMDAILHNCSALEAMLAAKPD